LWALHVILIGWLVKRIDVLHLAIGQYFLCGLFSVTAGIVFETQTLSDFSSAWWAIIYTGFISVGIGYTLQASSQ
jgi:drug/metabolite transporter (DMT)-like permease